MTAPGAVIFVVGALFLLIAIMGGGLEMQGTKIPKMSRVSRVALMGLGTLACVIGILQVRHVSMRLISSPSISIAFCVALKS